MSGAQTVVYDAAELVVGPADADETGPDTDTPADADATDAQPQPLQVVENGAIAIQDGRIRRVGPTDAVLDEFPIEEAVHAIDARGRAVIPGFVDAHTHALFAGDRSDEFARKLRGTPYRQILAEGGGILRTVRAVRDASEDVLLAALRDTLDTMLAHGTTTVEIKSGYGLDVETERRMLSVIERAGAAHPVSVVPTFMGAHAVPEGQDPETYVDSVISEQIPAVADQGIAQFCDVFTEEGVFTVDQSRRGLESGMAAGMTPKVHAEELTHLGGAQLAAEVGAASADHLLHATDEDIEALVDADVTPVLLPGTAFGLDAEYPVASRFFEAGAPVAVATDFNPNCHSESMGFALALACVECGMTPAQALLAGTRNGARALNLDDRGALRPGYRGDVVVLDAPSYVHVPYSYGVNRVETVIAGGRPVHGGAVDD